MFDHIRWNLGKIPLMILNGSKAPLDAVADTNLDSPALGVNSEVVQVVLAMTSGDMSYSTEFAIAAPRILSCWDFILTVNEYCNEIELGGSFRVRKVSLKKDKVILQCV